MKRKYLYQMVAVSAVALSASVSEGAGYRIRETNGLMANSFAGENAVVGDCSTLWNNPASMTYIKGHVSSAHLNFIFPYAKFRLKSATGVSGNDGGNGGQNAVVPALYGVADLHPNLKFGLSINSPWGLETNYDRGWIGRYFALKSKLETINITPALGFKINDQWSIGFGLSAQWARVTLTNKVKITGSPDAESKLTGRDWAFGTVLGLMFEPWKGTRFGLSYHSQINHQMGSGDIEFRTVPAALFSTLRPGPVEASLKTPHFFNLSASHDINPAWTVLGDVMYTNWASNRDIRVNRLDTGAALKTITLNWHNTFTVALGAVYKYNPNWTFRFGTAFDQTPTRDAHRTPVIPDQNRYWLSAGADYTFSNGVIAKLAYAHLFVESAKINQSIAATPFSTFTQLSGRFRNHVDIVSVHLNWKY